MITTTPMSPGDRVRAACDAVGGVSEMARLTGIGRQSLYDYMALDDVPSTQAAVAIARAAGWSVGVVGGLTRLGEDGRVTRQNRSVRRSTVRVRGSIVVVETD